MASQPSLGSLPGEIILKICQPIAGHPGSSKTIWDPVSLAALCRASRRLNFFATPALYSRFLASRSGYLPLRFLMSICLRPELGEYVRELDLYENCHSDITPDHLSAFNIAAARLGISNLAIDLGPVGEQSETILQLLIAQTPGLRYLYIIMFGAADTYIDKPGYTVLENLAAQVPRKDAGMRVTGREIIEILEPHKDTIKHIAIDLTENQLFHFVYTEGCQDGDQILSVRDFSQLQTFEVDGGSVLFPEIELEEHTYILKEMLPSSLKWFFLTSAQTESVANLHAVADCVSDYFPFLEWIYLASNLDMTLESANEKVFNKGAIYWLHDKLLDAGVSFSFENMADGTGYDG
ncbi:hypothetical protein V8C42DRAFT_343902 [Trichoderma barbatum]